jgi:hypothetical protein
VEYRAEFLAILWPVLAQDTATLPVLLIGYPRPGHFVSGIEGRPAGKGWRPSWVFLPTYTDVLEIVPRKRSGRTFFYDLGGPNGARVHGIFLGAIFRERCSDSKNQKISIFFRTESV